MSHINENPNLEHMTLRTFREAMKKLDDRQLVSLVQQLVDERDSLLKRQEHLVSLSKLWEKTIAEAEIIAEQLKEEARIQAEEDKNRITNEARCAAEKQLNEHISKSTDPTQEGIQSVKQKWQLAFSAIEENSIKTLESRLAETALQISETCSSQIDVLKRQSALFRKELEQKFAELENQDFPPSTNPANSPGHQAKYEEKSINRNTGNNIGLASIKQTDNEQTDIREQRIIEILPPRDKERIDKVRNHLNFYEEVLQTEIQHLVDRTFIVVDLVRATDLVQIMSDWPEIEHVQEVVFENQKRIQISLGVERELAQEKDRISSKFSRITQHIKPR